MGMPLLHRVLVRGSCRLGLLLATTCSLLNTVNLKMDMTYSMTKYARLMAAVCVNSLARAKTFAGRMAEVVVQATSGLQAACV